MAKGFCLCERYSVTRHPWNATWCYICDRPIAPGQAETGELVWCEAVNAPAHNGEHSLMTNCRHPHLTGRYADDGEAESVRIAEVFDQARTDLDRDN